MVQPAPWGKSVASSVRLSKAQWMKLQQFAMDEGQSLQGLAIDGSNKLLTEKDPNTPTALCRHTVKKA